MNEGKVATGLKESDQQNGAALYTMEKPKNGFTGGQANWAYQHDTTDSDSDKGSHSNDSITSELQQVEEGDGPTRGCTTHSIILDISTTSFADTVTVKTLKNVCAFQDLFMLTISQSSL